MGLAACQDAVDSTSGPATSVDKNKVGLKDGQQQRNCRIECQAARVKCRPDGWARKSILQIKIITITYWGFGGFGVFGVMGCPGLCN